LDEADGAVTALSNRRRYGVLDHAALTVYLDEYAGENGGAARSVASSNRRAAGLFGS
jgi:hypothetical protein